MCGWSGGKAAPAASNAPVGIGVSRIWPAWLWVDDVFASDLARALSLLFLGLRRRVAHGSPEAGGRTAP
jgi:hypothetical protein